jgi:uncharacterized membrane protein YcaP (DUF421 family)
MTAETLLGMGVDPKNYTVLQVCMRTLIIFFAALLMIRIADRRFLARKSGFDTLVGFVLASTLSRAINGSAQILPTIVVGFLVIFIHRGLAKIAFHSDGFSKLIKGQSEEVIRDGKLNHQVMARYDLTEGDLIEDVRLLAQLEDFAKVHNARIERNGQISVIPDKKN